MNRVPAPLGLSLVPARGWSVVQGAPSLTLVRVSGGATLVFERLPQPPDPAAATLYEGLRDMVDAFAREHGVGPREGLDDYARGSPQVLTVAAGFQSGAFTRVWFTSFRRTFARALLMAESQTWETTTACNQMVRTLAPDTGAARDDTIIQVAELIERLPGAVVWHLSEGGHQSKLSILPMTLGHSGSWSTAPRPPT